MSESQGKKVSVYREDKKSTTKHKGRDERLQEPTARSALDYRTAITVVIATALSILLGYVNVLAWEKGAKLAIA
ncbi:MAG: hypothetical protein V2B18_11495, partial [Pseudomonadota bacterium]